MDSIFFTEPLYVSEADDNGNFNFKYLAPGDYVLLGIERSAAGASLVPQRMAYGVCPKKMYSLGKDNELKGITMRPKREIPPLKMTHGELLGQRWGWLHFNQPLEDNITLDGLTIIDSEQTEHGPEIFKDEQNQERFLLISPDTLSTGKAELTLNTVFSGEKTLLDDAKINLRVPSKVDTSHIKRTKPEGIVTVRRQKDGGPVVPIVFSKPVISISDSAFFMVADTDTVVINIQWVNPMEIAFLPPGGWQEKTQYKLMIFSNKLSPVEGKMLKDSISVVRINSEKKLGYGGLSGTIKKDGINPLLELRSLKKEPEIFRSSLNSNLQFEFKNIPEGPYHLMIIDDLDRNGDYSYGAAYPFRPSEWFYIHPDTFDVRANWDIDVGPIKTGEQ